MKDMFTMWTEAFPCQDMRAETIAKILEEQISVHHGPPNQIHNDLGTPFMSGLLKEVCEKLNISKTVMPTYNLKSNPVERTHEDLWRVMRGLMTQTQEDWEEILPAALMAIWTARNRHTGITPFWALYGREATMPVDIIYPNGQSGDVPETVYGRKLS